MVVMVAVLYCPVYSAAGDNTMAVLPMPPAKGNLEIVNGPIDFKVISTGKNEVQFFVPVFPEQTVKEGLGNPDWQVNASWAWTDGQMWFLVPQKNYAVETKPVPGGLRARLVFSAKGNGWFWVRIWGQTKNSKFLWIDQNSAYCRYSTSNKPGYEFLVHLDSSTYWSIPDRYDHRP